MRDRDYKFFNVAKSMAELSTWSEETCEQVGAVIVIRNEIVATGYNRRKTFPMQALWAQKAGRPEAIYPHAEISALHKLGYGVNDLKRGLGKIYVYRETKTQGIAMARPCEICSMALKAFGIKNVFYTTPDGYAEEVWDD